MSYATNQPRAYDDQSAPYLNIGSTPIPHVTSYTPSRAGKGSKLSIYISSLYELMTASLPTFFVMFGSGKCTAALTKLGQQGGVCQYVVETEVPPFSATGWSSSQMPVFMLMESSDGELLGRVDVGGFGFVDASLQAGSAASQELHRKRKISMESAELMKSPVKRSSGQQLRPKDEFNPYGYAQADPALYSPYLQSSHALMPYGRSPGCHQQPSPRPMSYQYSNSTTGSPPTIRAQSPQAGWSPYSSHIGQSPGLASVTSRPRLGALPSPAAANPPLIRTSTLQQTPSPATTPAGAHHAGQPFNPYALYPHKAVLKIQGDLQAVTEQWSQDEWDSRRRIVLFKRTQAGSTITTTFRPVSPDERPPNSVCISCIWWAEKKECYVTSVDTIYLLEQLVAARFTVEEKNRIRRNLEGFRPLTVSKAKPDSEEFFKVIMAFPTPKPRNIEKDVKVFPWKILAHALKKIISKYVSRADF